MCCNTEVQPDPEIGALPRDEHSPLPLTFPCNINGLQRSRSRWKMLELAHVIHPIGAEVRGGCEETIIPGCSGDTTAAGIVEPLIA
jgi:hypothetical protein